MFFSERTQRAFDKYTRKLVRRQPTWLKLLFDEGKIFFTMEDTGILQLGVHTSVDKPTAQKAGGLIAKYMDKHPHACLGEVKFDA